MAKWIYVDNSSLFIEGKSVSAIDLYQFLTRDDESKVARAVLFDSDPLENEHIRAAKQAGFEIREKKLDTHIVGQMVRDSHGNADKGDAFKLVAGEKNYVPAVKRLILNGMRVDVIFWDHVAIELKEACSTFISLNQHFDKERNRLVMLENRLARAEEQ